MRITGSRSPFVLVAAAIVLVGGLTACSSVPVQGIVGEVSGGTVDVGGTEIPSDFPTEVPLPDGAVVNASRVGTGTGKVWNVTLDVSGQESSDGLGALYTDAGFQATSDLPGLGSTGGNAGYSNGNYGVLVVVTDDGADTYTANFSVTAIPK